IRDDLVTGVQTCALPIFDFTTDTATTPAAAAQLFGRDRLCRGRRCGRVIRGAGLLKLRGVIAGGGTAQMRITDLGRIHLAAAVADRKSGVEGKSVATRCG